MGGGWRVVEKTGWLLFSAPVCKGLTLAWPGYSRSNAKQDKKACEGSQQNIPAGVRTVLHTSPAYVLE